MGNFFGSYLAIQLRRHPWPLLIFHGDAVQSIWMVVSFYYLTETSEYDRWVLLIIGPYCCVVSDIKWTIYRYLQLKLSANLYFVLKSTSLSRIINYCQLFVSSKIILSVFWRLFVYFFTVYQQIAEVTEHLC